MEAVEMLDVLHFYFEDDVNYTSAEQAEAHGAVRLQVYKDLYDVDYKYAVTKSQARSTGSGVQTADGIDLASMDQTDDEVSEPIDVFNPKKRTVKSYVAPTSFNPDLVKPFGDILDQPIN